MYEKRLLDIDIGERLALVITRAWGMFWFISTRPEGQVAYKCHECGNNPSVCVITNLFPAAHVLLH